MKPKYQSPSRLLASLIVLAGTPLHAANLTWDGQGGDASWLTGANWVGDPATVTMGIDSIQTFNTGGALNLTNYLGGNTTIGKLHFNANAVTNVSTTLADLTKSQSIVPFRQTTVAIEGEGNFPAIAFRQRFDSEAPSYIVEVSDDLKTWKSNSEGQPAVTTIAGTPVDNADGTFMVTARYLVPIPSISKPLFLRIRVTGP